MVLVLLAGPAGALTFTVDSMGDAADTNTADNTCIATAGGCTLRAAIEQANASAGLDTIKFGIAGGGVHTITPGAPLSQILEPVFIDGYQQPGASQNTLSGGDDAVILVELNGSTCIRLHGVRHPKRRQRQHDPRSGHRALRHGHLRQLCRHLYHRGNFIGTDPTGTIARSNEAEGIRLDGAVLNLVGGSTPPPAT
jgi:hypothetical protein